MIRVKLISIREVQAREIIIEEKCFNIDDVLNTITEKSGYDFFTRKENYMIMKNSQLLKPEGVGNCTVADTDTVLIMPRICGG